MLFVNFLTHLLLIVLQTKHLKQLLTKEICLLSEVTTYIIYFLIEIGEKDMKVSLFYLIEFRYSHEISVLYV